MPLLKSLEVRLRRLALHALVGLSHRVHHAGPLPPRPKLLFIRLNNIGDALVTTPLLHAARTQLGATVHVLASPRNRLVFAGHPDVDAVHVMRKGLPGIRQVAALAKAQRYDALIDLHDDTSTTVSYAVALAPAPRKFGLARGATDRLYTAVAPRPDPLQHHVVARILALAPLLGLQLNPREARVVFPIPTEAAAVAQAFARTLAVDDVRLVGVNISAGSDARWWGVAPWQQAIRHILDTVSYAKVVLMAAPADAARVEAILTSLPAHRVHPYVQRDYRTFAAILPHLQSLVTPDTAVVHLASAVQVPVFGLYVAVTDERLVWYPYRSPYRAYCTPRQTLAEVPFADVAAPLSAFLAQTPALAG